MPKAPPKAPPPKKKPVAKPPKGATPEKAAKKRPEPPKAPKTPKQQALPFEAPSPPTPPVPPEPPPAPEPGPVVPAPPKRERRSAEKLAKKQREISISEFFAKNRHLLGFDSPAKALLTAVKEAVDNALDACEEAGILPVVKVEIVEIEPNARYRLAVEDNGPGIVKAQVPRVFGKLLYGSKFHRLRQSRGQQGIGISAAGLYGLLTTGKPVVVTSRTGKRKPAHHFELVIDTKTNEPNVIVDTEVPDWPSEHGTRVEIELTGAYKAGKRSVDEYLEQTALANPHAEFHYMPPRGRAVVHMPRVVDQLPAEPEEIKPHPHGVELGVFMRIVSDAGGRTLSNVLTADFSRVSSRLASDIIQSVGLSPRGRASTLAPAEVEKLYAALQSAKLIGPSLRSVVPIGEALIRKGLEREAPNAEFYITRTRPPRVYRGNPFLVEVGLAYGGTLTGLLDHVGGGATTEGIWVAGVALEPEKRLDQGLMGIPGMTRAKVQDLCHQANVEGTRKAGQLSGEDLGRLRLAIEADLRSDAASRPIELVRLANRVPLLYQQSACAATQAVIDTNWKRYGLAQPRGGIPQGPLVLVVHIASVWVPFTSESKEAIAHYPEIIEEIQRGLQECGRQLGAFLNKRAFARTQAARRDKIGLYASELVEALHVLTGRSKEKIKAALETAQRKQLKVEEVPPEEKETPISGEAKQAEAGQAGSEEDAGEDI